MAEEEEYGGEFSQIRARINSPHNNAFEPYRKYKDEYFVLARGKVEFEITLGKLG